MRKEMDPKIQAAATSYAEQFSGGTTLAHFVALRLEGSGVIARIEYDERRAKAWAYQSGGECFYRFYARRRTRTLNVAKTAAFDASAFANSAMRAKGPAVWASLGGLRGICAPYTRGASLCQSGNKRSPREKRMAFARLKKSP